MAKRNSIYNSVIRQKVSQSVHNLSYSSKGTMDVGKLYPVFLKPTVPGDVWYGGSSLFMRSMPMVSPLLTNINVEMRYFWVPNRMVWHNWTNFLTDQDPSTQYDGQRVFSGHFPHLSVPTGQNVPGKLADWLGVPIGYYNSETAGGDYVDYHGIPISALPYRAYCLIWNEYFRDENLHKPIGIHFDDTNEPMDAQASNILPVCWKKDRFSSALPFPQKGDDVDLNAIVRLMNPHEAGYLNDHDPLSAGAVQPGVNIGRWKYDPSLEKYQWDPAIKVNTSNEPRGAVLQGFDRASLTNQPDGNLRFNTAPGVDPISSSTLDENISLPQLIDPNGSLSATVSLRRLRQASAIQRILEAKAVAGSRYSEYILSMYGVRIPDAELNRPVYLGGGKAPLNISPVEQTSSTDNTTPQGNLAGKGVAVGGFKLNRPFLMNDFGYIIGVAYIRTEADYMQGLPRHLWFLDREDFYNPEYQLLGQDVIKKGEVSYSQQAGTDVNGTFGYQTRYAELKSSENEIHGDLKFGSMRSWVTPRTFNAEQAVALNEGFVNCNPDMSNNFAVANGDHFVVEFYHNVAARRPMYFLPVMKPGML